MPPSDMTNNKSTIKSSLIYIEILLFLNVFSLVAQDKVETKNFVRIYPKFQGLSADTIDYDWIIKQDRIVIEKDTIPTKKFEYFKKNSIVYEENSKNRQRLDIKNYRIVSWTLNGKCVGARMTAFSTSDSLSEDQLDYLKYLPNDNRIGVEVKIEQIDTKRIYETSMQFVLRKVK